VRPARKRIGRFHLITDTVVQTRFGHVELAQLALAGGADTIQLRDKRVEHDDLVAIAIELLAVCRPVGVPLIINDSVEAAAAAGADGVHLGRGDAAISAARKTLGAQAIIGGSADSLEAAIAVEREGADYVGFGHIFATESKNKTGPPVGIDTLGAVCAALGVPVVAIGGVTAGNAGSVITAGAWGVAVIGAVCGAEAPDRAARSIRDALDRESGG
jgi:thiamine-phosphate pyrophosphorylase